MGKKEKEYQRNEELIKLLGNGVPDDDMDEVIDKLKYDKRLEDFRSIHRAYLSKIELDKMRPLKTMIDKLFDYQTITMISELEDHGQFVFADSLRSIVELDNEDDVNTDNEFFICKYFKQGIPGYPIGGICIKSGGCPEENVRYEESCPFADKSNFVDCHCFSPSIPD